MFVCIDFVISIVFLFERADLLVLAITEVGEKVDLEDYEKLANELGNASPLEIMDRALAKFGNDIAIAFRYLIIRFLFSMLRCCSLMLSDCYSFGSNKIVQCGAYYEYELFVISSGN